MQRTILGASLLAAVCALSPGQTATTTPTFEVASIKVAPPPTGNNLRVRMGGDAGRLDYNNVTLRDCIRFAYSVKDYQISGPDWLRQQRYDLVAKIPEGAPRDQVPAMLQALLVERFKLTVHRETKELPVYALVVGKNGPKITPSEITAPPPGPGAGGALPGGGRGMVRFGGGGLEAKGMTVAGFAELMARMVDRPILDMTELKGNYDFKLQFTPEAGMMRMPFGGPMGGPPPPPAPAEGSSNASGPSIFTAVQEQLGLKLEGRKAPVEILVIDAAEKVPTEN